MRNLSSTSAIATVLLFGGCSKDLGECDPDEAQRVVYGRFNLVVTAGQALTHDSCGNGSFCHSAVSEGDARAGAPRGLNFDMAPEPAGWYSLWEHRESAWAAVTNGTMPPSGAGQTKIGDGAWYFDRERKDESQRLPSLKTDEGKEIFRNFLACGLPTVSDTIQLPPTAGIGGPEGGNGGSGHAVDAGPEMDAGPGPEKDAVAGGEKDSSPPTVVEPPDWGPLYGGVVKESCAVAACHDGNSRAGGLDMSSECVAYEALKEQGPCGAPRVVAGNTDSLLVDKIGNRTPHCKLPMPPVMALPTTQIDAVREWVAKGAHSKNCD